MTARSACDGDQRLGLGRVHPQRMPSRLLALATMFPLIRNPRRPNIRFSVTPA